MRDLIQLGLMSFKCFDKKYSYYLRKIYPKVIAFLLGKKTLLLFNKLRNAILHIIKELIDTT